MKVKNSQDRQRTFVMSVSFFIAMIVFIGYIIVSDLLPNTLPIEDDLGTEVNTPMANLAPPDFEPIPPTEDSSSASSGPDQGAVDLRLMDHGRVIVLSDTIIIQYNDSINEPTYELTIPLEKTSLDAATKGTTGSTPIMELIFSEFNPQMSLQENINKYLKEAFIFYEVETPPSDNL